MHTPVFTERGDPLVIFIHGFMGSPDQFADMADAVVSRGGSALSVLLPGHGGDSREFARCGADAWEAHVRGEIARHSARFDGIFLVGHSMGGLLALLASAEWGGKVRGVFLLSTPVKINVLNPHANAYRLRLLAAPTERAVLREYLDANSIKSSGIFLPLDWLRAAIEFERLVRRARRRLGSVTAPTVIVHSRADETVAFTSAKILYGGMENSERVQLTLSNSRHAHYTPEERESVLAALIDFIEKRGGFS